ncbi:hypothetical protein HDC90_000134 [Pedobacter sp. AK013]|uniref:outer membrane beta-barrel protein n=1 Tax=Pedobacter sp. AK013 TaxID=2723071 RepID=UPI00160DD9A1|nr:outer membrane beta-barrel protein [Pedobacter sp. AK013]MBB6235537.1 hypothetical protein [Pedobacter sp. AK013]
MIFRKIQLLLIFVFWAAFLYGQTHPQDKKLSTANGSIAGFVVDSISKNALEKGEISVYNTISGKLIKRVQINSTGHYSVQNLPVSKPLFLIVDIERYKLQKIKFELSLENRNNKLDIMLSPVLNNMGVPKDVKTGISKTNQNIIQGAIHGKVKDSTYRNVLTTATVSVYSNLDSKLLSFRLPNELGEFVINKLPLNTPIKLLITHIGFTPVQRIFTLTEAKHTLDFNWILMQQNTEKENTLEEIRITSVAPVRMNGDTLEFNPRAFKMDVNATAEDLMRILPGIVIWGDGDITFNGKKISSLLVDGKPFMGGGDFTTATQNLPKEILDKVQIYRQRNDVNPLDSTLSANLKLKDDKKIGFFGKIGAGYGTGNRFSSDAMLNGFTKTLQLSTVGAFNNINKLANNITTLIRNNSFKGEGNTLDYQPDFRRAGVNTSTTAGAKFQYDFLPDLKNKKSRRFIADYFMKRNNEVINGLRFINTILKTDSILSSNTSNQSVNINANNNFSLKYTQQNENFNFAISADATINENSYSGESTGEQYRTGTAGKLSTSNAMNTSQSNYKRFVLDAKFNYQRQREDDEVTGKWVRRPFSNYSLNYKLDYQQTVAEKNNKSSLVSGFDPGANKFYDRRYMINDDRTIHLLDINYPLLKELLFGTRDLGGLNLELGSNLTFNQGDIIENVFDIDPATFKLNNNEILTNSRIENIQDIQPRLSIKKSIIKGLTNRYSERFDFAITPTIQYFSMSNRSSQLKQNFNYQYHKFIPNAFIKYNNHQYGDFEVGSSLDFITQVKYPTLEDIAPLVDSARVWYIPKGNLNIKPEYTTTVSLKLNFESRLPKNPYQININIDGNFTKNKIADSTNYDELGRRINSSINLNGSRYWHFGGFYRKAYSPNKNHTFRFNIWYDHYAYLIPQYLNSYLVMSRNNTNDFDIELTYSFSDIVNVNAKQGFGFYKNSQTSFNDQYRGQNNYTRFSGTLQFPKNLTWSSNININANKALNQATINYTIWNASLAYRFLQGNQAEIKLSALDLLKQNKAVINTTNRNISTFGFNNVLQQYFMLSLSYYPRKFGKNNTVSE